MNRKANAQKRKSAYLPFDKIFYPTLSVFLENGHEAIESFGDQYLKRQAGVRNTSAPPKPHLVIVTRKDIQELGKIAKDTTTSSLAAEDVLKYIETHQRDAAGRGNQPIDLGENLFMMLEEGNTIRDVQLGGLEQKLQVVCQTPDEVILYRMDGFRASLVEFDKVNTNIRREGIKHIVHDKLYAEVIAASQEKDLRFPLGMFSDFVSHMYPNQYIVLHCQGGGKEIVGVVSGEIAWNENDPARFSMDDLQLRIIPDGELFGQSLFGIKPRDLGQRLYLHALRQPHITRLFVTGNAACGKTLIGYAGALAQTLRRVDRNAHLTDVEHAEGEGLTSRFSQIFITKTNDLIGGVTRARGFLPGNEYEKMFADIQSYVDAHDELALQFSLPELVFGLGFDQDGGRQKAKSGFKKVDTMGLYVPMHGGIVKVQDYAHWRGRTIGGSVIFLDEAQNLRPIEFKHLNQRVGTQSLVIISGDYEHQLDNENMSKTNNGLFQGIKHYLGQPYVAVIHLEGSYRDAGAEHASRMPAYR